MQLFALLATVPFIAAFPAATPISPALDAPGFLDPTTLKFHGDGAGQKRSPCPMLNAAANYEVLPYDGKCITADHIKKLVNKLSLGSLFAALFSKAVAKVAGERKKIDAAHADDCIDLDDLRWHGMEHDLSMSKFDVEIGKQEQHPDDQLPSAELVDKMIEFCRSFARKSGDKSADLPESEFLIDPNMLGAWHGERKRIEVTRGHKPDTGVLVTVQGAGEAGMMITLWQKWQDACKQRPRLSAER